MIKELISLLSVAAMIAGLLCACVSIPAAPSDAPSGTTLPVTTPTGNSIPNETDPTEDDRPSESTGATDPATEPTEVTGPTTAPTEPPTEPIPEPTEPPTDATEPEPAPTEPPAVHTHTYHATVTKPTCSTGGYTTHTCACGSSYIDTQTAAAGHSYKHTVTAPTCTKDGYTTHTCTTCGSSYTDTKTAATGHNWSDWTVTQEPTITSTGTKQRTCSLCGTGQSEYIPTLIPTAEYMQQEVLRLVNLEREKEGLAPLEYVHAIQGAADLRASEIIQSFSHTRPDGSSCFTVLQDYPISYFSAGENIASGYRTPEAVVKGWMNSPGHRANILSDAFTGIVIGFEDYHWVQLFIGI